MTKSTITRERLLEIIAEHSYDSALVNALEHLLAIIDSEPVAAIDLANLDYLLSGADADVWPPELEEMGDVLLYSHPQPAPVVPDGLIKAVEFYDQVKRENPPVETGAWKDAVDWVLKEACRAAMLSGGKP